MSGEQSVGTPRPSDRSTGVTVALIGLVAAFVSAVLPWGLSKLERSPASAVAAAATAAGPAAYPWPDLTLGVWKIRGAIDEEGTDFTGSTLRFNKQAATPAGLQLEGFFEWRGDGILMGREYFRANLDAASRQIFIQGGYIEDEVQPPRLAVGSFSAKLSPDGRELCEGTWGSTPGHMPAVDGGWSARR